jgi:phosphohistidine phosphatase
MRRLLLLRHAKSDWSGSQPDHGRPLAARGRAAAPQLGHYLARHGLVPDRVLCSTAVRARETWELLVGAFDAPPPVSFLDNLYDVDAKALLAVVKQTPADVHSLLLIGHNPGIEDLAALLIAAGDIETRQRLLEKFPTAALAVIDFPLDDWAKLHPEAGRLDRFVTPRLLEEATD